MKILALASLAAALLIAACSSTSQTVPMAPSADGAKRTAHTMSAPITGDITEYVLPTASAGPAAVAVDASENVWVTDWNHATIDELASGWTTWSQQNTPTKNSEPLDITIGPDGNPWFTEFAGDHVGVVDESNGNAITEYAINEAFGISTNPDGYMYVSSREGALEQLSTNGTIKGSGVESIPYEVANDGTAGDVWYTTAGSGNSVIERLANGTYKGFSPSGSGATPYGISSGPNSGYMWFTELYANKIASITTKTGAVTEYTVPTASSEPIDIITDCGNLWFTESSGNNVGEMTPLGSFTEYAVPTKASGPDRLAVDGEGNIWFAEHNTGKIGMIPASIACP